MGIFGKCCEGREENTGSNQADLAPVAVRALAVGASAVGAIALGTLAIGAVAIGAVVIGRLVVRRSHIHRLEIDELMGAHFRVTDSPCAGQGVIPTGGNPVRDCFRRDPAVGSPPPESIDLARSLCFSYRRMKSLRLFIAGFALLLAFIVNAKGQELFEKYNFVITPPNGWAAQDDSTPGRASSGPT